MVKNMGFPAWTDQYPSQVQVVGMFFFFVVTGYASHRVHMSEVQWVINPLSPS
jgi:hypothetical protein